MLLLITTGIFTWSHFYYEKKSVALHDEVLVLQYKVLDSDVWMMQQHQKQQLLSKDSSYEELSHMQKAMEGARNRSVIGYWIATISGVLSAGYLVYVLWFAIYVEMIRAKGYMGIVRWAEKMARKLGDSSELPKG